MTALIFTLWSSAVFAKAPLCDPASLGVFVGGAHAQVYAKVGEDGHLTKAKYPCPRTNAGEDFLKDPVNVLGSFQGKVKAFAPKKIYPTECGDTYGICLTPECKLHFDEPGLADIFVKNVEGMSLANFAVEKEFKSLPEKWWKALEAETRARMIKSRDDKRPVKPAKHSLRKLTHLDLPQAKDIYIAGVEIEDTIADSYGQVHSGTGLQFVSASRGPLNASAGDYGLGARASIAGLRVLTARYKETAIVVLADRYGAKVFSLSKAGKILSSVSTSSGQAECD